jgi:hypothetical protein
LPKPVAFLSLLCLISSADNFQDSLAVKASIIRGRPIAKRLNSKRCFDQIHEWTYECLTEHATSCPLDNEPRLPTRVIDTSPEDGSGMPKVFVTDRRPGTWLALSHCWGLKARFVLDSGNLLERQNGMAMQALPPTFRDAIEVTRRLGYRYLWIDSLCILQDSYKDWEMESALMQEYYQNSILTIALDTTPGDHCGFLNRVRELNSSSISIPFQSTRINGAPSESDKASLPVEQVFLRYFTGKKTPCRSGDP